MTKYCNIVNFAATYEQGVYIDSRAQEEWDVPAVYSDLINYADDDERKKELFDNMPEPHKSAANRMVNAYHGMTARAQFNGHIRGPHIFHTEEPLTDAFLIDWAKHNVFKKEKA